MTPQPGENRPHLWSEMSAPQPRCLLCGKRLSEVEDRYACEQARTLSPKSVAAIDAMLRETYRRLVEDAEKGRQQRQTFDPDFPPLPEPKGVSDG